MKSNVVYYILLLLDSESVVRIPGLGVLKRRVHSAEISSDENSVKPPRATVDFSDKDKNKGKLLARFISYKSGVDTQAASEHIEEFASSVKSTLLESGKASIDYLGVFYQENEHIRFTADPDTANAAYYGLRSVELPIDTPITDESEESDEATNQDADTEQRSSDTSSEATGLAAIVQQAVASDGSAELESEDSELPSEVAVVSETPSSNEAAVTPESESGMQATEEEMPTEAASEQKLRIPVLLPIFLFIFLGVTALAIMQYNKRGAIYHPASSYNRAPEKDIPIFGGNSTKDDAEMNIAGNTEAGVDIKDKESDISTDASATNGNATLPDVLEKSGRKILGLPEKQEAKNDKSTNEEDVAKNNLTPKNDLPAEQPAIESLQIAEADEVETEKPETSAMDITSDSAEVENAVEREEVVSVPVQRSQDKKATVSSRMEEDVLTSDCYVIVGAFGVQSNVDRMIARLKKMGYSAARMSRNRLTQIGVPAACGSAEVERVLADLQQNVEAEAWIYNR